MSAGVIRPSCGTGPPGLDEAVAPRSVSRSRPRSAGSAQMPIPVEVRPATSSAVQPVRRVKPSFTETKPPSASRFRFTESGLVWKATRNLSSLSRSPRSSRRRSPMSRKVT